jgi:ribonuclease BN (tRNA processing enzyme)
MPLRYTVLASGSSGNASLLEAGDYGVLIDIGLGPRQLAKRMAAMDVSWQRVHAVVLSHTHGDHWREKTLAQLRKRHIPLYCHQGHHLPLSNCGWEFGRLQAQQLIRSYESGQEWELKPGFRCRTISLRHDAGPTHGFRFDRVGGPDGDWSLAYVADLGSWTPELAQALAEVDVLAVEFNHDVQLEYASRRSPELIARVLGDHGHLSNTQAAALVQEVIRRSSRGRLRHLVQLHLSRDCNRFDLAVRAAQSILPKQWSVQVHTTSQDGPGPVVTLEPRSCETNFSSNEVNGSAWAPTGSAVQAWLPGWT